MRLRAEFAGGLSGTAALLMLAGCGSADPPRARIAVETPALAATPPARLDEPVKIGTPYEIGGRRFIPADTAAFEEVGYASWYGAERAGMTTANGERFDPDAISAAHRTLPMPSYVEVTALDSGRTILVRINDRGPFRDDRIIDLSQAAATELGFARGGVGAVRVRRVQPPDFERAVLRAGGRAATRSAPDAALLAGWRQELGLAVAQVAAAASPPPAAPPARPAIIARPAAIGVAGSFAVQLGAFASRARADALATATGAEVYPAGALHRVRLGPFAARDQAEAALRDARASGYADARIVPAQ